MHNYALKILSHYGRVDWPKRAPNFIDQCLELASTPETATLGAVLLRTVSEEWTSTKGRIKSNRRTKLKAMLATVLPNIVSVFASNLAALWEQNVQESPSSGGQTLDAYAEYQSNFDNNNEAAAVAKSVLEAFKSFIHWAPLDIILSPAHIDLLFRYSMLNDCTSSLALDSLNEMMERNFVPQEMSEFLVQLHTASMSILSRLVKDETVLASMDPDYIHKWTLYINWFVNNHLDRAATDIPLSDFLALFIKFTFFQPTPQGFLDCLDIWEVILTLLENLKVEGNPIDSFADVIFRFVDSLTRALLFRYNADQLERLEGVTITDETTLTDTEELSELDEHLNAGLTAISIAYTLFPESLQAPLVAKILEPFAQFFELHTVLVDAQSSTPEQIAFISALSPDQAREIHWAVRDVSTSVRAMTLVGTQFINDFEATFNDALSFINSLVELTNYTMQHQLFRYDGRFTRLTGELFCGMRSFGEWFDVFWGQLAAQDASSAVMESLAANGTTGSEGSPAGMFGAALTSMYNCDLTALNSRSIAIDGIPPDIVELIPLSAAWHLRIIASSVRSPVLHPLHFPAISQFMEEVYALSPGHTSDVQQSICIGLVFMHLMPWQGIPAAGQMWAERSNLFGAFFENIAQPFNAAGAGVVQKQELPFDVPIKNTLDKTLVVLTGILREAAGRLDRSGLSILWQYIQPSVEISIGLIENYLDDMPMLFRLLQLHIEVFSVLSPLVPGELANNILQTIITNLSGGNRLETILDDAGGFGTAVAQRLLSLLKALVSRPKAPFLREAFDFCVERIWPSVDAGTTATDVEQSFYEIWCELLSRHYRFLSQDAQTYNMSINCFLRAFQGQDLEIFKLVAHKLMEANSLSRIFSQDIFWNEGFASYLATLLHVMIRRTHESLHDVILQLIFAIVEGAGFEPFFSEFLPTFLQDSSFSAISPEQREALRQALGAPTDQPTLTKGIADLTADLGFLSGSLRPE